jgi:thiol-disulfide isomerase/thioredoxin
MHRLTLLAALLVGSAASAQTAAIKPLTIGDKAPAIDITHFVKGDVVTELKKDHVYIIEFWATWCGPCKASMPHLSETQEKYEKDVTIISVSDEDLATVVGFLAKSDGEQLWYDKIDYTLTTDPDESVKNDYFRAAGQRGIPAAFIVGKDLHIEWIGHPMRMDDPLEAVVNDTWDRKEYKAKFERAAKAERESQAIFAKLRQARKDGDWEQAISLYDQVIELDPERYASLENEKARIYLQELDDADKGLAILKKAAEKSWDNAMGLNGIAWGLVDDTGIEDKSVLRFALKVAERANDLSDGEDASILDTLARVHYEMGDLRKAIKVQKEAVKNADAGPMKDSLAATLKKYEDER